MEPKIIKASTLKESLTSEGCHVSENWGLVTAGDKEVSVARARVEPGVTAKWHYLEGVQEIYVIVKGTGKVYVGDLEPTDVVEGDVVVIPPKVSQRITNTGESDLLFYCVCTPSFTQKCYHSEEEKHK
jgi:mannose-6-phosphate isomerase-like protein (cupin superfamily)